MLNLILMALAPIVILLFYIFIRDKFEKEPYKLLLMGVIVGALLTYPILFLENIMVSLMPVGSTKFEAFYLSFVVAALCEEGLKFISVLLLVWHNRNYNEKFDGLVYAVFISLGFASYENILYVTNESLGGVETAILRAFISVPAHFYFGIFMGYYLSKARYENKSNIALALLIPLILHGTLDFILSIEFSLNMVTLIAYILLLGFISLLIMKNFIRQSPFRKRHKYKV